MEYCIVPFESVLSLLWIDSVGDDDTITSFVVGRATVPTDTSKGVSLIPFEDYFKVT